MRLFPVSQLGADLLKKREKKYFKEKDIDTYLKAVSGDAEQIRTGADEIELRSSSGKGFFVKADGVVYGPYLQIVIRSTAHAKMKDGNKNYHAAKLNFMTFASWL